MTPNKFAPDIYNSRITFCEKDKIKNIVEWSDIISDYTTEEIEQYREFLEAYDSVSQWLRAESAYFETVKQWLNAEHKHKVMQVAFSSEVYALGKVGWEAMRKYVPNLDGKGDWETLAPSLKFRYAAFAAAVTKSEAPEVIRSMKQEIGRTE